MRAGNAERAREFYILTAALIAGLLADVQRMRSDGELRE